MPCEPIKMDALYRLQKHLDRLDNFSLNNLRLVERPTGIYTQPVPPIDGWMSPQELQFLYGLGRKYEEVVEIGCWFGRSTHAILTGNLEAWPCGMVYAVDTFNGSASEIDSDHVFAKSHSVRDEFQRNCGHFKNLDVIQDNSEAASLLFEPDSVDAVFIDAEHTFEAVITDLSSWANKVRLGGLLCGHDRKQAGVPTALQHFFGELPPLLTGSIWGMVRDDFLWRIP